MKSIDIKSMNIKVFNGELVGIIGTNGSGKTNFLKKIMGKYDNNDIFIDDKCIIEYDIKYKQNNIVCVFNDNIFQTNKPKLELRYFLTLIKGKDNDKIIKDFIEIFKLDNILNIDFDDLTIEDRYYVKILSLLILNPSIICIDDLFGYLKADKRNRIINYIKENDIILFSVTSEMEDLMLYDKLLVLSKGKNVMFDDTLKVLENEDLFNKLGIKLPFIYNINSLLNSYELINERHLVSKELIDLLWK